VATSLEKIMKHLFLTLIAFSTFNCFSQDPNPDLFQTWYLNSVQASDLDPFFEVSEIEPTITPTLIIDENYNFSGEGACNSFSGIFNFPFGVLIETSNYSNTNDDCGIQIHNDFENSYFFFITSDGFYDITQEGDGLVLTIGNPIFGEAIFRNFQLGTTEFKLNDIQIYPNPSTDLIFIKSQNNIIEKIEIYNSIGQLNDSKIIDFNKIDITDLASGIYMLKIFTDNGIMNKKIIKK
jgi:hypothetical protein